MQWMAGRTGVIWKLNKDTDAAGVRPHSVLFQSLLTWTSQVLSPEGSEFAFTSAQGSQKQTFPEEGEKAANLNSNLITDATLC